MQQLYSTRLNGLDLYFIKMDGFSRETVSTSQYCCIALSSVREKSQVGAAIIFDGSGASADLFSLHKAKIKPKER